MAKTYTVWHTSASVVLSEPLKAATRYFYNKEDNFVPVARVVAESLHEVWEVMSNENWAQDSRVEFIPITLESGGMNKKYEVYPYRRMYTGDVIEINGESYVVLPNGFGGVHDILFNPFFGK